MHRDAMRDLRILRYERLNPRFERTDPKPFYRIKVPLCDPRAQLLEVFRDGMLMVRDSGVPVPETDLDAGTSEWRCTIAEVICVRGFTRDAQRIPDGCGKYLGSFVNDDGAWLAFLVVRVSAPSEDSRPEKPDEPRRRYQSASESDPLWGIA